MKRTFLGLLLLGSSCAVFAQDDSLRINRTMGDSTVVDNNIDQSTMTTSTEYNAYGAFTAMAPDYVQSYVVRDYPTAAEVRWRQTGDWWHGYYTEAGQPMHVYYNNAGQTFRVALPVRQSLIPDDVVTHAVSQFGPMIYDVNTIKGANGQEVYHVRLIDNGQVVSQWLNADGTKAIDIWRVDVADADLHTNMNVDVNNTSVETTESSSEAKSEDIKKMKIKTETKDGKEIKTKIKNGKTKTKIDD